MMDIQVLKWTLTVLYTVGAMATIASVGKERKPLTGGMAAFIALIDAGLIAWIQTSL